MKTVIACVIVALTASTALAGSLDTNAFVSAATGDWNKDEMQDLVLMTRGEEGTMDVSFFLLDKDYQYLKLVDVARGKVWGTASPDGFVGQAPSISALPNGSIQIYSHNDAAGRSRWEQTLTIAYRNSDFVVAGFTYKYYDTLDENGSGECDLNVLTGKGKANLANGARKVAISVGPKFIPLKDWPEDGGIKDCGIEN